EPAHLRRQASARQNSLGGALREHPKLSEGGHELVRLAGQVDRSVKLILRDPRVTVSDHRDVPVTSDLRCDVDTSGAIERAFDVIALHDLIARHVRPVGALDKAPQLIPPTAVIPPGNQHWHWRFAELRIQRQRIAVHLPPQQVPTMIGPRDPRLILIPSAKLRVNHIHERVLSQPRPVSPARKTFMESSPLTPRVVKTPDLVHNLAREIQHRTAGQVEHTMLAIPADLPDRPVIRRSLKLELKML